MTSSFARARSRISIIALAISMTSLAGLSACGDSASTKKTDAGSSAGDGDKGGGDGDKGSTGDGDQTGRDAGHPAGGDGDTGGDGDAAPGAGIDEKGFACLSEVPAAAGLYFGVQKKCILTKKKDGTDPNEMETMAFKYACTFYNTGVDTPAKVVESCPAEDRLAYCTADTTVGGPPNQINVTATTIIYKTEVNADTDTVSRNPAGTCQPAFDASTNAAIKVAKCSGSFQAKVDGVLETFTDHLTCAVARDSTTVAFSISGSTDTSKPDNKSLLMYVLKTGEMVELKSVVGAAPYGYYDGSTPFAIALTANPPMISADNFDAKGAALKASFSFGLGKAGDSTGADARVFTEGSIDVTFE